MRITFKFHGGLLDGQVVAGDTDDLLDGQVVVGDTDDKASAARRYVFLTDCGRVGKRFREWPPERREEMRRLVMPDEVHDAWKSAMQAFWESVDWQNPPSDEETRTKMNAALREHGVEDSWQSHQQSTDDVLGKMQQITSQLYEVSARNEHSHGIEVDVTFIGEDTGPTMHSV